jgi:hypothetical protein
MKIKGVRRYLRLDEREKGKIQAAAGALAETKLISNPTKLDHRLFLNIIYTWTGKKIKTLMHIGS